MVQLLPGLCSFSFHQPLDSCEAGGGVAFINFHSTFQLFYSFIWRFLGFLLPIHSSPFLFLFSVYVTIHWCSTLLNYLFQDPHFLVVRKRKKKMLPMQSGQAGSYLGQCDSYCVWVIENKILKGNGNNSQVN